MMPVSTDENRKLTTILGYSGEAFNDYAFKDGRILAFEDQGATMAFTSAVTGGAQEDQLSVWISADFDGNYEDIESVWAANWTNVTSRFELGTSATFLASGTDDISGLIEPEKPLYIGFKYVTRPQAENGLAQNWMIQTFTLTSDTLFNDVNVPITDQANAGLLEFVPYDPESPYKTPAGTLVNKPTIIYRRG